MTSHPAYELFEELGRGTNTVVYRSYDLSLGREVAIKELDEAARRDPRHRERFLREAQFLAQFEHDNVLRVYSVDPDRGWIIMELMKGTLASKIDEGPSDPDLVRSVLKQTLDALQFLHEKQKVHGTVRPTNLLINDMGRVKLSEFEQTAVGGELRAPTGSKKYLAPELIRPEFGEFGPATDLYCLGFTALELLKGPQFEGLFPGTGKGAIDADIAWLRWHSSPEELASTKKLVKGIPDDLAHVLDRMLKKRVADRAQTAQEVLKELADRPLVPVPVAGGSDVAAAPLSDRALEPGRVRELAPGQKTVLPPSAGPSAAPPVLSMPSKSTPPARKNVAAAGAGKPSPPAFSKDWFNQQLGRPYVLYPLCAAMLLAALWYVVRINSGGGAPPIPVTFALQPAAAGAKVLDGEVPVKPAVDGTYALEPGVHKLTFRKEGFHPKTQEFDVSAEKSKFAVQLEPIIKWVDVTIQVTPAGAKLTVDGKEQSLADGSLVYKHQDDKPLVVAAQLPGFVSTSKSIAPDELAKLSNKVLLELAPAKPQLPAALVAKPGAAVDPEVELPVRALAAKLGDAERMEFALVKPGKYTYGTAERPREGELAKRSVEMKQPYYVALNEVTNAQYEKFAAAGGESKAGSRWRAASEKWATPLGLDAVKNNLPVTNVSSGEAAAFAEWLGGSLPTEIEWECAVRGADDGGYPQPWGAAEPTRERCQIFFGDLGPVPVDKLTAGASPLGLLNAIGNAAEWCENSEPGGGYVLRGCSFATANIDDVRVTWRRKGGAQGEEDTGFRVVVPVEVAVATATATATATTQIEHESRGGPTLMTPVVVLYSLPWDKISRDFGLRE